jgi:hypothetical protein
MKFSNGWKAYNKQWDKIDIKVRISLLTIFSLKIDISRKEFKIKILNFGLSLF